MRVSCENAIQHWKCIYSFLVYVSFDSVACAPNTVGHAAVSDVHCPAATKKQPARLRFYGPSKSPVLDGRSEDATAVECLARRTPNKVLPF